MTDGVVLAHDYATQRGGAERVALLMARAFPRSPMYVTLYDPDGTFPEFGDLTLRPSLLNRSATLRRHHRLALPLLAPAVSRQRIVGRVLLASSSGWAHGYRGADHTVVYCHAPARWLYQPDRYLGARAAGNGARFTAEQTALRMLAPWLRRWDRRAAGRADVYLANSTVTQRAVRDVYGIDAEVLAPPPAILPGGDERPVNGLAPGFLLCVARLLPYKNVDVAIKAAQQLDGARLVVVGDGPDRARLSALLDGTSGRVRLLGRVNDPELRWLYRNCAALVASSYEDFGLSPLEAAAFGRPTVALRAGGYLDTVREGTTGVFFDDVDPALLRDALADALGRPWNRDVLVSHAEAFSSARFCDRLQGVVAQIQGQT